jgi:hypothetical protein
LSPSSHASFAAACPQIRIICALPNHPALGRKVSDEFTVPLCRGHHREVHHCCDEAVWWQRASIDPSASARTLWLKTHPLPDCPIKSSGENDAARASAGPGLGDAEPDPTHHRKFSK